MSELIKIHDELLSLSGYPDSYPMVAMKEHLRNLQSRLGEQLRTEPPAAKVDRDSIIQVLLSTSGQSEGITADSIMYAFEQQGAGKV
jgi:hypothetical protein